MYFRIVGIGLVIVRSLIAAFVPSGRQAEEGEPRRRNVQKLHARAIRAADGREKGQVYPLTENGNGILPASTTIGVVPGFPTDPAKITGGNFTPFAVFFANDTTMYVTDEGSGNALDQSSHAGLEKWSLVGGTWQLDYLLTTGLTGVVDTGVTGPDGQYPDVTTLGLRNMTGVVHGDNVTIYATTSTSSASGDPGADPNKVVVITDKLSATTMTGAVAKESFQIVVGPTYGTAYRGVAFVN